MSKMSSQQFSTMEIIKVKPMVSLFNYQERKQKRIQKNRQNLETWFKKNPQAHGKEAVKVH